jgi:tetratricopeptide (TPR) repeat protein
MLRFKAIIRRADFLATLGLFLGTVALFARAVSFDFINFDDPDYVTENPHVQAGFTSDSIAWALTSFDAMNWHPLTWLSLQLDVEWFGSQAWGFHLTNVLLHGLNTALLFLVLNRMTNQLWPSALVAALFGWHPLHVESVAWVAERKDVLSTFCWLLTMWAYLRYTESRSSGRYCLVLLFFALGLMAKPMVVTLPCALLLLDYWPLERTRTIRWQRLVAEKIPMFILVAVTCYLTVSAQAQGKAITSLEHVPLSERMANVFVAYSDYLLQMVWPANLAVYYPLAHPKFSDPEVLLATLVVVAISAAAIVLRKRYPYWTVGWFWYLGTLVPVIGLVQVGGQARADRYTYVPLIGIFLLVVWTAIPLANYWRVPRRVAIGAAGLVLTILWALAWLQLGHWKDSVTLWLHSIEATGPNDVACSTLGGAYAKKEDWLSALAYYSKALEYGRFLDEILVNRGYCFVKLNEVDKALEDFEKALSANPNSFGAHINMALIYKDREELENSRLHFLAASQLRPTLPAPYLEVGMAYFKQGKFALAQEQFLELLRIDPQAKLAIFFSEIYLRLGRSQDAVGAAEQARRENPENAQAYFNLGVALWRLGQVRKAYAAVTKAVQLRNSFALYRCYRGFLLYALGDKPHAKDEYDIAGKIDPSWQQHFIEDARRLATNAAAEQRCGPLALELAQQACQASVEPGPEFLDALAMALAETGQLKQAIETTGQALKKAQESSQPAELIARLQAHLQSYEKGQPIRE